MPDRPAHPLPERTTVFLADDNLLVREGVRALLSLEDDIEIVGVASDYDELIDGAEATAPSVLVTDIRMPPTFQQEGIEAAKAIRKRYPGTGVVVLSQFDDPDYAVALLRDGAAGYAYLVKDRVAESSTLVDAIRAVASGASMLDPRIVDDLISPVASQGELTPAEEALLQMVGEGKPIKAIAAAQRTAPAVVADQVEKLFLSLARGATEGSERALRRLRMLHQAIVDREEQGESLSRLLPGGIAEKIRAGDPRLGETDRLVVTVLMSDVRDYSAIAERSDPARLAIQLNEHRAAMNKAVLGTGGTVMQFVGDAVMAVFGAPVPRAGHADHAVQAAEAMHCAQDDINERWRVQGLPEFGLGIGISTGEVAAALLGSEERLEYSVVGDAVNLTQRLQQLADAGETVLSEPTRTALTIDAPAIALPPTLVKGRETPVRAFKIGAAHRTAVHRSAAPALSPTPGGTLS